MSIKLKRWHKITLISIAGILAILIFFNIWLNSFIRDRLEEDFNASLNATVKIDKLRVNLLTGKISIYDISLIGNKEFKNDTLIFIDKICLSPSSFDSKTGQIDIEQLTITNLKFKSIISEKGNNCWDNISKKNPDNIEDDSSGSFNFFVKKLQIENAEIKIINRQSKTEQTINKLNIVVDSQKDGDLLTAEFTANCVANTEYTGEKNFALDGKLKYDDKLIDAETVFTVNGLAINVKLFVPIDSLSNANSTLKIETDIHNIIANEDIYTNGKLIFNLSSKGVFNTDYKFNFESTLEADSLIIKNKNTNNILAADFILMMNYNVNDNHELSICSKNIILSSGKDQISGDFSFLFNDSILIAESNLSGSFSTSILEDIFAGQLFNTVFSAEIASDLSGKIDKSSNNLLGAFNFKAKFLSSVFELSDLNMIFNKNGLTTNTKINSEFINGDLNYEIGSFQNFIQGGLISHKLNAHFNQISFPASNQEFQASDAMNLNSDNQDFKLPKNSETQVKIVIDSLFSGKKAITDIDIELLMNPNLAEIKVNSTKIGTGKLHGIASFQKNDNLSFLKTDIELNDLDLSFFASDSINFSGIINLKFKNTIYGGSDSLAFKKNEGINTFKIENFSLKTDFFRDYEIDEDYITIKNTEIVAEVKEDLLILLPSSLKINDADIKFKGNYNLVTDSISYDLLFDISDKYLSSKVKLGISIFSESYEKDIPEKEGRYTYLLRILGTLENPEYKVFE
jgi:hypothetical protein